MRRFVVVLAVSAALLGCAVRPPEQPAPRTEEHAVVADDDNGHPVWFVLIGLIAVSGLVVLAAGTP